MPSADVSARVAWDADAPAIAAVQVRAWRTSYADLLPAEVLATLGEWHGPLPSPPEVSEAADANRLTVRLARALRRD